MWTLATVPGLPLHGTGSLGQLLKLLPHRFLFCKMGMVRITADLLVLHEFH